MDSYLNMIQLYIRFIQNSTGAGHPYDFKPSALEVIVAKLVQTMRRNPGQAAQTINGGNGVIYADRKIFWIT